MHATTGGCPKIDVPHGHTEEGKKKTIRPRLQNSWGLPAQNTQPAHFVPLLFTPPILDASQSMLGT